MSSMTNLLQASTNKRSQKTFYPTPEKLATKLLADVDWNRVVYILEPSAGKGDLADYAIKKLFYARHGYPVHDEKTHKEALKSVCLDCIEIDPVLRSALEGSGFRVIHDNFLNFETQVRYNMIIMNPPFDEGAEHLLKAIEIMRNGGKIYCILNAETIRNPYSATRQRLVKKLESFNATISYELRAFSNAERQTDVDVALIRMEIPEAKRDSTIMEDMRKAPTYKTQAIDEEYAELVRYNKIDEWVNRFNYEVACGVRLIQEWKAMEPHIADRPGETFSNPILKLVLLVNGKDEDTFINEYIRQTRLKYWSILFKQDVITEKLTTNLINELNSSVSDMINYEFSAYNILTLIIKMNMKVVGGIQSTIIDLFDDWTRMNWNKESPNRHYFDGWVTNDCFRVGAKVILPFYGVYDDWYGKFRAYNALSKFKDIEKVFDFLDNGNTNWEGSVGDAFRLAEATGNTRNIDTKYFTATFYKKGTAHLVFKNKDLLEKFNLFAGCKKGWLPPCYGKKSYRDMTEAEKHVIDSFQGKERYAQIMERADYYLDTANAPLMIEMSNVEAHNER